MKKITLFITMLISFCFTNLHGQTVYVDFEDGGKDMTFDGWSGPSVQKVAHPSEIIGGINTSAFVGAYTHPNNNWWGGVYSTSGYITPAIDFSANPFIKIKVYADQPIPVLFKLEQDTDAGNNAEVWFNIPSDKTNQWVEVILNFEGVTNTGLNKIVMFMDPNDEYSTDTSVYYFDDIVGTNVAPTASITYSPEDSASDISLLAECKITSNLHLRNVDDSAITDVSTIAWLKEGSATGVDVPFTGSISGDKSLVTITPSSELKASTTYFYGIDDNEIEYQTGVALTGVTASFQTSTAQVFEMYNDFDGTSECVLVEGMTDDSIVTTNIIDQSGNNVLQWDKGSTMWGWERVHLELTAPINLNAANNIFTINVYAPAKNDGNPNSVMLKLMDVRDEGSETGKIEKWVDLTKIDEWETLTFVLEGNYNIDYDHMFIFGGESDKTYYFDNIQGPGLKSTASIKDFEIEGLAAYPNPTSSKWTISTRDQQIQAIDVYNVIGKRVLSLKPNTMSANVDASILSPGVYIATITTEKGTSSRKLIKN